MALPPLATLAQLAVRLGLDEDALDEDARAGADLEDASTLVREEARRTWVNDANELVDVPDVARLVTLSAARRAYENPNGITQKTAGDVSISYAGRSSSAVYLTDDEKKMIRRAVGRSGLHTVSTTRGDCLDDTIFVPVVGTDTQFPWYAGDELW